jgi:UDP-glucose 4-epimerase
VTGRFLVTGGAGYVGSHLVAALIERGASIVVVDNLSTGHRAAVLPGAQLVVADVGDPEVTADLLADGPWDAVFHFAALSLAGESMRKPFHYLIENATAGIRLIEACVRHRIRRFVLSSTAALYAANDKAIDENDKIDPGSPYGESKWMIERALHWADRVCGLRYAALRYFNAAGADPAGRIGEDHRPETRLIPLVIDAALGRRPVLEVYGSDYPTEDGTCIRDYVHVSDLARMHLLALDRLRFGSVTYNLGNGRGYSVLQVIDAVQRVTGLRVPYRIAPRRPGDPARLVATSARAHGDTGWTPQYGAIEDIVNTAFVWRKAHPDGYDDRR